MVRPTPSTSLVSSSLADTASDRTTNSLCNTTNTTTVIAAQTPNAQHPKTNNAITPSLQPHHHPLNLSLPPTIIRLCTHYNSTLVSSMKQPQPPVVITSSPTCTIINGLVSYNTPAGQECPIFDLRLTTNGWIAFVCTILSLSLTPREGETACKESRQECLEDHQEKANRASDRTPDSGTTTTSAGNSDTTTASPPGSDGNQ
jgi:hypothetical protein